MSNESVQIRKQFNEVVEESKEIEKRLEFRLEICAALNKMGLIRSIDVGTENVPLEVEELGLGYYQELLGSLEHLRTMLYTHKTEELVDDISQVSIKHLMAASENFMVGDEKEDSLLETIHFEVQSLVKNLDKLIDLYEE